MLHELISKHIKVSVQDLGAEISSIKDHLGIEYVWQAEPKVWPRYAPVLFPIVGKLQNNNFIFGSTEYTLSQHGFARDQPFKLIQKGQADCLFELCSTPQTKRIYPFDFIFRIGYRLHEEKITINYEVINPSNKPIYFSLGAHPGFNCPILPDEKFEDYYLEFEYNSLFRSELLDGLRTGAINRLTLNNNKLFLSSHLFDQDALVFENSQINRIRLCSNISGPKLVLDCKGWPYFGIWTKKGCRDFVCLEPWYGITDKTNASGKLEEKEGILCLDPGKDFKCSYSIRIC